MIDAEISWITIMPPLGVACDRAIGAELVLVVGGECEIFTQWALQLWSYGRKSKYRLSRLRRFYHPGAGKPGVRPAVRYFIGIRCANASASNA